AAAILDAVNGPENYVTLVARNELADVLRAEHRFTEAEKLSAPTVSSLERAFPARDTRVVQALKNRWRLLHDSGRSIEATAVANRLKLAAASEATPDNGADRAADGISGVTLGR